MLKKAYVEITNACNLRCGFCRGTARRVRFMPPEDFRVIAGKLRPHTEYIYLHLLGEPLLHPRLGEILGVCDETRFKVTVVTNGTLIGGAAKTLLSAESLYKVCFSLHAYEANALPVPLGEYLSPILRFSREAAEKGVIAVLKLWNGGGENSLNGEILETVSRFFGAPLTPARGGCTVIKNVYIDLADRFSWPDPGARETPPRFCMALRDQLGVLSDGTAVPCCLDADGTLTLGNLLTDGVEEILASPRARDLVRGFSEGRAVNELCRRCDFAKRRFG